MADERGQLPDGAQGFQSDGWFKDSGTATGRMAVPGQMYVWGNSPYYSAYQGGSTSPEYVIPTISNIYAETNSFSIYDWRITVQSDGGGITLYFTDETGDEYKIAIVNPIGIVHHVSYNSAKPAIVKVRWER